MYCGERFGRCISGRVMHIGVGPGVAADRYIKPVQEVRLFERLLNDRIEHPAFAAPSDHCLGDVQ